MNTQSAQYGLSFQALRAALHLPQGRVTMAPPVPVASAAAPDWLERLALWAERQPMHHRMGSYTQRR